jgi:hypothetical protein
VRGGQSPIFDRSSNTLELGPYQLALLGLKGMSLGVQQDCVCETRELAGFKIVEQYARRLVVETTAGDLLVIVRQRDAKGKLVRTFAGAESTAMSIVIRASQDGHLIHVSWHHDRVIWSGMSWGAASIDASGTDPIRIEVEGSDFSVTSIDLEIWRA